MAYVGQIVDIFVSSPGDVDRHRDSIVSIVQAWNQRNGRARKLFFNCLRWEDLVAPDIGESGQSVINEQLGGDYDIFLGVMWARFGTPTSNAESGTEEEFERAVSRHKAGEPIKVSFLFCTADIPVAQLDGVQFAKVQEFKRRAHEKGCLTRDFLDEASLTNSINLILDRFANTWGGVASGLFEEAEAERLSGLAAPEAVDVGGLDEPGLFDVLEDFERHNLSFVDSLNSWSERLNIVQDNVENATSRLSDLSKFGKPSPQAVRPVLNDVTAVMEGFGDWCEDEIVKLERVMEQMSKDTLLIMDVSRGLEEPTEDMITARDALISLHDGITSANEGILAFADSVDKSPRLDKKLNRANRKVVVAHRRLAEKNRLFQDDVALCIADLTQRLDQRGEEPGNAAPCVQ